MDRKDDQSKTKKETLTTEQCPRCRHPLRKNSATGEKICGNCGYRGK